MRFDSFSLRLLRSLVALAVGSVAVFGLHGCGTATRTAEPPGATTPAQPAASRASSLGVERQWLQSWFEGTPVRIVQQSDGAVSVEVPREFCFSGGQSKVKPPLAVVLDKVGQSLLRTPNARLELLAAPGDDSEPSPLAQQRSKQLRRYLLARGVPAAQLGTPSVTTAAAVQLRMEFSTP